MASVEFHSYAVVTAVATYVKDGLFDSFEVRVWPDPNGGGEPDLAQIHSMEGEDQGSNKYYLEVVETRKSVIPEKWWIGVRVRNKDGQVSDWVTANDTDSSAIEADIDIEGAARGKLGLDALGNLTQSFAGSAFVPVGETTELGGEGENQQWQTVYVGSGGRLVVHKYDAVDPKFLEFQFPVPAGEKKIEVDDLDGYMVTVSSPGSAGKVLQWVAGDGGAQWVNPPGGPPDAHVLATTAGLGAAHTTSGLTAGQVLRATAPTTAAFQMLTAADIPSLAASKVTSGTFDTARIPSLPASQITSGTFGVARGGTGLTTLALGSMLVGNASSPMATLAHPGATKFLKATAPATLAWNDVGWADVTGKPATFPPDAHILGSHSDMLVSSPATGTMLYYTAEDKWDGRVRASMGREHQPVGHGLLAQQPDEQPAFSHGGAGGGTRADRGDAVRRGRVHLQRPRADHGRRCVR